jgi:hypothetical protein
MNFRKTIVTAVVGAGIVLAFSIVSASADIVCNDMGVCWHTHNPYDYPPEAHVTVHENEWHWGPNKHYAYSARRWSGLLERRQLDRLVKADRQPLAQVTGSARICCCDVSIPTAPPKAGAVFFSLSAPGEIVRGG